MGSLETGDYVLAGSFPSLAAAKIKPFIARSPRQIARRQWLVIRLFFWAPTSGRSKVLALPSTSERSSDFSVA